MKRIVLVGLAVAVLFTAVEGARRAYVATARPGTSRSVPTTTVKRGDVVFEVVAQGQIQGGNSEMLNAPMTGGREMVITFLRTPGELIEPGDIVVQFDTTEQEHELSEAEADMAEAEQQLIQARATTAAREEESRYALLQAEAQVSLAELETRTNSLRGAIQARQNELALEAARDRLKQLQEDFGNRQATSAASIAIQEAAIAKAKARGDQARRNIEAMTLRAASRGYVDVQPNSSQTSVLYTGMRIPEYQLGDTTRAGQPVAQIPDLENWQVMAQLGELDQGHVQAGQGVAITVIAVPEKAFDGEVVSLGGTTGTSYDRRALCIISLDNPTEELRQGMSARIVINTGREDDVLWIPSQALFDNGGRPSVYLRTESGFQPREVELVRRGDMRAVIRGVDEGDAVALVSPAQTTEEAAEGAGVMEALPES